MLPRLNGVDTKIGYAKSWFPTYEETTSKVEKFLIGVKCTPLFTRQNGNGKNEKAACEMLLLG